LAIDCQSARVDPALSSVPESPETRVVRDHASDAGLLDRNTSWGPELWFKSNSGSYLLCADDCSSRNEALGITIRYAFQFEPLASGSYRVTEQQLPECPE
jgi:hypothetical protein